MLDPKTILIFDIDGTLINIQEVGDLSMSDAFNTCLGIKNALAGFSTAGRTDLHILCTVAQRHGLILTNKQLLALTSQYLRCLKSRVAATEVECIPGVRELLGQLSQHPNVKLVLGTGNLRTGAKIKLSKAGLWQYFETGGWGSDGFNRHEVIQAAITKSFPSDRDTVVAIGDTPRDIEGAHEAGIPIIAMATGNYTLETLREHAADAVLPAFTSITAQEFLTQSRLAQQWYDGHQ
jgi:phosphoglycolate phosphatase